MKTAGTVDEYIRMFGTEVQEMLRTIRQTIHTQVPTAVESISYGMPTFKLNGKVLLHFAAFKKHIGVYATPEGHAEFESELRKYTRGKGSVQLPYSEPIPYELIGRIARYRASELTKIK